MDTMKKTLLHGLLIAAFAVLPVGASVEGLSMPTDKKNDTTQCFGPNAQMNIHKDKTGPMDKKDDMRHNDKKISTAGVGFGVYAGRGYYGRGRGYYGRGYYRPYYGYRYHYRPYYRPYYYSRPYYYWW